MVTHIYYPWLHTMQCHGHTEDVMVIPTRSKFRFHENKFVFTTFEKSFLRK